MFRRETKSMMGLDRELGKETRQAARQRVIAHLDNNVLGPNHVHSARRIECDLRSGRCVGQTLCVPVFSSVFGLHQYLAMLLSLSHAHSLDFPPFNFFTSTLCLSNILSLAVFCLPSGLSQHFSFDAYPDVLPLQSAHSRASTAHEPPVVRADRAWQPQGWQLHC
jgi:hypothetical protein